MQNLNLTHGEAKRNGHEVRGLYEQQYATRSIPCHPTSPRIDRRLRKISLFAISNRNAGHSRNAGTPE